MSVGKKACFEDREKEMEAEDDRSGGGGGFHRLPEGCVSHVLALTSPRDACRAALVSPVFFSAAASDTVWDAFLPPDHSDILSRAVDRVEFSSKRELFFRLCDPILIDGGKMSFFLERSSGKKCFMLSARALTVIWGDTPKYWRWDNHLESRFSEVAELLLVWWFEIRGKLNAKLLSRHTKYAAYLVFKLLKPRSYGLGHPLQETSVKLGAQESSNSVCLNPIEEEERISLWRGRGCHLIRRSVDCVLRMPHSLPHGEQPQRAAMAPRWREDGWMEMELGEFENEQGDDGEVEMSLMEVKGGHPKRGIIIEGIELRPKH